MMLEICFRKGVPSEISHSGKVRKRIGTLVLSCKEGGACCWLIKGDKRRLGSL